MADVLEVGVPQQGLRGAQIRAEFVGNLLGRHGKRLLMAKFIGFVLVLGFVSWCLHHIGAGGVVAIVVVVLIILALRPIILALRNASNRRAEAARIRRAEEAQLRRDLEYVKSGMAAIDLMPGVEFEKYVAARLRRTGWDVSLTAASGDYGVDLIARKGADCMAIQCKRYAKPVGVSAVQQVVAGSMQHRCTSSMVVSNQEFTTAAKRLAGTHSCQLVGRAQLPNWTL
jgi:restriction system protein